MEDRKKYRFIKPPNMKCLCCNREFYAKKSEINRGIKYCCRECYVKDSKNSIEKICEHCGKKFEVHASETKRSNNRGRFCSIECYWKRVKTTKEKQNRVIATCKQCGKEYEVNKYRKDTTSYCSYACRDEWRRINLRGENHWQYKPKTEIICKICGTPFYVNESRLKSKGYEPKYCSYVCMGKDRITTGDSFGKYCEKFNREFKHRVKEFFDNTCALCRYIPEIIRDFEVVGNYRWYCTQWPGIREKGYQCMLQDSLGNKFTVDDVIRRYNTIDSDKTDDMVVIKPNDGEGEAQGYAMYN